MSKEPGILGTGSQQSRSEYDTESPVGRVDDVIGMTDGSAILSYDFNLSASLSLLRRHMTLSHAVAGIVGMYVAS